MFKPNFRNRVSQAFLAASVFVASVAPAHAGVLDDFFDAVDLSSVSAKVIATGLLIVGIAVAFKGPDLAKRIIKKV